MAKIQAVISHWDQLYENFQTSSLGFYEAVELGLKNREVPQFRASRVDFKEAGLMTAKREYLRIVRGKYTFDICAAPFGTGFFFSWWLVEQGSPFGFLYLLGFIIASFILFWLLFVLGVGASGMMLGVLLGTVGVPAVWWLVGKAARDGSEIEEYILVTPIVGTLYERIFTPSTYFVVDSALMFQQAVHNAVLEVIDQVTAGKGVRALSEFERKPILKSFAHSA